MAQYFIKTRTNMAEAIEMRLFIQIHIYMDWCNFPPKYTHLYIRSVLFLFFFKLINYTVLMLVFSVTSTMLIRAKTYTNVVCFKYVLHSNVQMELQTLQYFN